MIQIKMKPGKPAEPGDYLCKMKGSTTCEMARIWVSSWGALVLGSWSRTVELDSLEGDTMFSERIELVIEEEGS